MALWGLWHHGRLFPYRTRERLGTFLLFEKTPGIHICLLAALAGVASPRLHFSSLTGELSAMSLASQR